MHEHVAKAMATGRGTPVDPLKPPTARDITEQVKNDRLRCLSVMRELAAVVENSVKAVRTAQLNQAKEGRIIDDKADSRIVGGSLARRTTIEPVNSLVRSRSKSRSRQTEGGLVSMQPL